MRERYRVTGSTRTLGHEPGSAFEADLPAEQERRMIARGSITREPRKEPQEPGRSEKPPARASTNLQQGAT